MLIIRCAENPKFTNNCTTVTKKKCACQLMSHFMPACSKQWALFLHNQPRRVTKVWGSDFIRFLMTLASEVSHGWHDVGTWFSFFCGRQNEMFSSCPGTLFSIMPVNGLLSSLLKPLDSFVCGKILKLKYNLHSHSYNYAALVSLQWHQTYLVQQSLKNFLWKRATRAFFHRRKSVIRVWKNMKGE